MKYVFKQCNALSTSDNAFLKKHKMNVVLEPEIVLVWNGNIIFDSVEELQHYLSLLKPRL
jgi:hypothetical protein